jgi:hypothetical protein
MLLGAFENAMLDLPCLVQELKHRSSQRFDSCDQQPSSPQTIQDRDHVYPLLSWALTVSMQVTALCCTGGAPLDPSSRRAVRAHVLAVAAAATVRMAAAAKRDVICWHHVASTLFSLLPSPSPLPLPLDLPLPPPPLLLRSFSSARRALHRSDGQERCACSGMHRQSVHAQRLKQMREERERAAPEESERGWQGGTRRARDRPRGARAAYQPALQ